MHTFSRHRVEGDLCAVTPGLEKAWCCSVLSQGGAIALRRVQESKVVKRGGACKWYKDSRSAHHWNHGLNKANNTSQQHLLTTNSRTTI